MRQKDTLILCCSLQHFIVGFGTCWKNYPSHGDFFLLVSFWVTIRNQNRNQELPVYGTDDIPVFSYSIFYCCLKSASILICQISAYFDHWFMCWNCVYHCKAFILVRKAIALKSVAIYFGPETRLVCPKTWQRRWGGERRAVGNSIF